MTSLHAHAPQGVSTPASPAVTTRTARVCTRAYVRTHLRTQERERATERGRQRGAWTEIEEEKEGATEGGGEGRERERGVGGWEGGTLTPRLAWHMGYPIFLSLPGSLNPKP